MLSGPHLDLGHSEVMTYAWSGNQFTDGYRRCEHSGVSPWQALIVCRIDYHRSLRRSQPMLGNHFLLMTDHDSSARDRFFHHHPLNRKRVRHRVAVAVVAE